jgi:hypothetical protein
MKFNLLARILFAGFIIFEFLNLSGVLNIPLDFSWLGLLVTAVAVWLIIELIGYLLRDPHILTIGLWIGLAGLGLDAGGDIFRLYSKFGWYDQVIHLIVGAGLAYLLLIISKKIFQNCPNQLIISLFTIGMTTLLGFLYELEEYAEDFFIHHRSLRLGDGWDTVNDMFLNLVGALLITFLFNLVKKLQHD